MKERRDLNKLHAGYLTRFSKNELSEEEDAYWTSIKNDIKIYDKLIFDNIKRSNAAHDHVLEIKASNPAKKKLPLPPTPVVVFPPPPPNAVFLLPLSKRQPSQALAKQRQPMQY